MKSLYSSILIGIVALFVFAPLAVAGPVPTWDKQINNAGRFKVLSQFGKAAVLDKETGLVWEQSPSTTTRIWLSAQSHCNNKNVGGRIGWRLPTIQELASLVDPTQVSPALPPSHPFTLTAAQEDGFYWSATTNADDTSFAWVVHLEGAGVGLDGKAVSDFVWCVRGGQGIDGVQSSVQ